MKKQLIVPLFFILVSFTAYAIDTDGDGVIDATEVIDGTDPNDPCNFNFFSRTQTPSSSWNNLDCDGDGLSNFYEGGTSTTPLDTDGDGIPDFKDEDDDNDSVFTLYENSDPNTDGNPSDAQDTDGDAIADYLDIDDDGDLIATIFENPDPNTDGNPSDAQDTDGDAIADYLDIDDDNDSINTAFEVDNSDIDYNPNTGVIIDTDVDGYLDYLDVDDDGDGVLTLTEMINGTNNLDSCDYILVDITLTPTNTCSGNTITGNIKLDYNTNGCDAGDFPLSNILVSSVNGSNTFSTFTDISGNYIQNTNAGNFSTSASGFSSSYSATPNAQTTNFVGTGNTDTIDFCVAPASTVTDLNIAVVPQSNPIPSNTVSYDVIYKNVGNTIVNGSVDFIYDNAKLTYQTSSVTPTTTTAGNLSYSYSTLNPYEIRIITITFLVSNAAVGDILVFNSLVNPTTGDASISDNSLGFAQVVSSTLLNRSVSNTSNVNETNDILVLEGNQIELQNAAEYLHYAIRFENTSASTISNLIITTELSDKLDWNTIQLQKKTHIGEIIILNGNQVTFKFDNINLSSGSRGYIAYRIKPKSNVVVGDVISSQSKLYFDTNPVILSNTASTTIVANTAGINDGFIENVAIYPNPTKDIINIKSLNTSIIKGEIYNLLGRLIYTKKDINGIDNINISNLENNIYLIKITDLNGNSKVEKIIKK